MLDLIERKWILFAGDRFKRLTLTFAALVVSVFIISVASDDSPFFYPAAASTAATYIAFVGSEVDRFANKFAKVDQSSPEGITFFDGLELLNLALVPIVAGFRVATAADVVELSKDVAEAVAFTSGALQVTLSLSLLQLVALFRVLGPLLITVVQVRALRRLLSLPLP